DTTDARGGGAAVGVAADRRYGLVGAADRGERRDEVVGDGVDAALVEAGDVVAVSRQVDHLPVERQREVGHQLGAQLSLRRLWVAGDRGRHGGDDVESLG